MDYPCGKFGDCSFSRFGSFVRTDRHTDADECFTPVGMNNIIIINVFYSDKCLLNVSLQLPRLRHFLFNLI